MNSNRPVLMVFSQTGSECNWLINQQVITPHAVIMHENPRLKVCSDFNGIFHYHLPNKPTVQDYENIFGKYNNPIICLHGFLRIIPPEICEKYKSIINLHPADICKYPELKGLDPINRVIKDPNKYTTIGVTIHRVTPIVDDGQVLINKSISRPNNELDIYTDIKKLSRECWSHLYKNLDQYML